MLAAAFLPRPSPSVAALACVLAPVRALLKMQRITLAACLSVSSQGREGVSELARQTAELLNVRPLEPQFFDRQIAFNLFPQVGAADAAGHVLLERRIVGELKQVLAQPQLKVSATCMLVPVFFGDSLSVSVQTAGKVDLKELSAALEVAVGVEMVEQGDYPTVTADAIGQDEVYVGRLRCGQDDPSEVILSIASDNVRKGAALNAVQIAELLIKHYL